MRAAQPSAILLSFALAGCASLPRPYSTDCLGTQPMAISLSSDGRTAFTTLDVLTYNIEGLGWPARTGRAPFLTLIGQHLAEMRAAGTAPDVVMFQEMFTRAAVNGVVGAGYPALVAGPARTQRRHLPSEGKPEGKRRWKKGEIGIHYATGGLAIVSRYPILFDTAEPFSKRGCAGFDCLSNKGVLMARLVLPGLPDPVDLFNTHMNSQRSSRVSIERRNSAHEIQARELAAFIGAVGNPAHPAVLAGDFNMRGSDERHRNFRPDERFQLVHQYCLQDAAACDVRMSWDGDAPWMDTQDLQYFSSGNRIKVVPLRIEAMFDGRPDSPTLSDHDAFRVLYRLSWDAGHTKTADMRCRSDKDGG